MKNIICIVKKNFRQLFRKKINIFVFFILPVLITSVLFGIVSTAKAGKYAMGVVDNDNTQISQDMLTYLEKTNKFIFTNINEDDINEKIISRQVNFAFVIPKGFAEGIYSGKQKNVSVVSIQGQQNTVFIKQYANLYINNLLDINLASEGNVDTFNRIYNGYQEGTIKFNTEYLKDKSNVKNSTEMSMGLFIMIILVAASTTANMLLKEKRDKTFYRISTAPVKPSEIIMANVLVNILILTFQIVFVLIMVSNVFNIEMYVPPLQMFILLFSFGFAAIGIGMLIMTFSNSTATASALISLVLTPSCMLSGCFWPRSIMPNFLQRISLFIPQSWVMDAIGKLQMGQSFNQVIMNVVIVLLFAVVFFLIAAYKIKRNDEVDDFI